jgi:cell division protein FtsI (penicillin-binding protein 3)
VPGLDVSLTIDRDIQFVAQRAIASRVAAPMPTAARSSSWSPRRTHPGDGQRPTFNPNKPGESPAAARNNPALGAAFEPGSTGKVMTLAAVIEEKAAGATTHITVPPTLTRAGKEFHDHDEHPTLKLTLTGVLAKSSNIGTILASERIGPQKLYDYLRKFGMGSATG